MFAYGQKDPIEVIGTFVPEIVCEISGNSCVDEFTVVKVQEGLYSERTLQKSWAC